MNRREFIKTAGAVAAGTAISGAPAVHAGKKYEWNMAMVFPEKSIVGAAGVRFARSIEKMSGGRVAIKVHGPGKLCPAFETFDAVRSGTVEIGCGSPSYWKAKHEACQFFTAVPFGLNAMETAAWLDYGGGQQLWDELYSRFNLKSFAMMNSGIQMGGWFNKEIKSTDDFKGIKLRMPGLGGEVLARLGAKAINLPPAKIVDALKAGSIDAAEWLNPFEDMQLGLYNVAKYYYWPGWHEPSAIAECFVNKKNYESLPEYLREIIKQAAHASYKDSVSMFLSDNISALKTLVKEHNVQLKRFPDRVLSKFGKLSMEVVREIAAKDPFTQKVYDSYIAFLEQSVVWDQIGEGGYSLSRSFILGY